MTHDQLFKELLQTLLPEFMEAFLPDKARQIDWSHTEFPSTELFTSGGQGARRTLDVVARVRTVTGEPGTLLIHVEVEADPRREFPARMYE